MAQLSIRLLGSMRVALDCWFFDAIAVSLSSLATIAYYRFTGSTDGALLGF
jgi:hypothetical protein